MEKNRWIRGLIEGIVALVFGIFILISPENANNLIGLAAGGFLLVAGIMETFNRRDDRSTGFIRGIVGLVGGAVMLALIFFAFVSLPTAYNILAVFLIAYGALGLFNDFFGRGGQPFQWGPVLLDAILVAWGVLIFLSRTQDFDLLSISGWVLIAIGVIIGAWALFVKRPKGADKAAA
jgi:uncharacterized membrane protein HdeD (DUF308 family)